MKVAFVLAAIMASVNAHKVGGSYRNRHLTTYQEVCFPTASPVAAPTPVRVPVAAPTPLPTSSPTTSIVTAPIPSPTKAPTSHGKGGPVVSGPTSKSAPVCPPTSSKSGGKGGSTPGGSTYKSPPAPGGSTYKSPPAPGGSTYKSPPGPTPSRSRPSSSEYHPSGPSPSGPGPNRSGPSPSKSGGPAPGCSRFLKMAATTLGFGSMLEETTTPELEQSHPMAAAQDISRERALTIISLNTTLQTFGSYPLPPSFSSNALLTWPGLCFDATVSISNFIPNCQGCSFLVTDGSSSCDPASIPVVTPFVDPTEISFNPYANSTFFDTDSTGSVTVSVSNVCTGTGPQDNIERPLLLLDPNGQITACGILSYVCP